jgi:hypothetical protein
MSLIHIGFTGTRDGMTAAQMETFQRFIVSCDDDIVFHHGDCVGADYEAHKIFTCLRPEAKVVVHPPTLSVLRAHCTGQVLPAKSFLDRNKDIVDACSMLIAAPKGPEVMRSGTWSTIRYARKKHTPIKILGK